MRIGNVRNGLVEEEELPLRTSRIKKCKQELENQFKAWSQSLSILDLKKMFKGKPNQFKLDEILGPRRDKKTLNFSQDHLKLML